MVTRDPFEQARDSGAPRFQRAGSGDLYYWEYQPFVRVTTVLGQVAGHHLMAWYAKTERSLPVAPLVQAGLYVSPNLADDDLLAFIERKALREISPEQAIIEACDWASNMREPERYRDHRGLIGTIGHRVLHEFALGVFTSGDLLGHLEGLAYEELGKSPDVIERYEALGKTRQALALSIAAEALGQTGYSLDVMRAIRPEFTTSNLESVTIDVDEQVAGTMDASAYLNRSRFEEVGIRWPFGDQHRVHVLLDYKFTRKVPRSVRYQMAAYACSDFLGNPETGEAWGHTGSYDGMACLHFGGTIDENRRVYHAIKAWSGAETIQRFYEDFCLLAAFYRSSNDLPRAEQSRAYKPPKDRKPKVGGRPCPFAEAGEVR